jgi:hypothetical protein
MSFGLCNAPATFTRLINGVLCPFINLFVIVYLDGILIFSNTWKENLSHVMHVLETLKENKLIANLHKFDFRKTSLIYLGHVIGEGDLRVDPNNTEAITKWLVPASLIELGSFMGETKYLKKFIANVSTIVAPLHTMTTKGNIFHWVCPKNEHLKTWGRILVIL